MVCFHPAPALEPGSSTELPPSSINTLGVLLAGPGQRLAGPLPSHPLCEGLAHCLLLARQVPLPVPDHLLSMSLALDGYRAGAPNLTPRY